MYIPIIHTRRDGDLFLGMPRSVQPYLDRDINTVCPGERQRESESSVIGGKVLIADDDGEIVAALAELMRWEGARNDASRA